MKAQNLWVIVSLSVLVTVFLYTLQYFVTSSHKNEISNIGEIVETVELTIDRDNKFWGENLFSTQHGDIRCEANTLTSVQTRVVTNFLDLEVYCRDINSSITPKVEVLPKPNTTLIGSYIQNYNGELYSKTSGQIYDFESQSWEQAPQELQGLYYLQPYKDSWIYIGHGTKN